MKIAVASTDGASVNEHFGRADRFLIYELSGEGPKLIKEEKVQRLSVNDPKHPFDAERFGRIAEALDGCSKVYITKIGEKPAEELKKSGIEPVIYEGPIENIPS